MLGTYLRAPSAFCVCPFLLPQARGRVKCIGMYFTENFKKTCGSIFMRAAVKAGGNRGRDVKIAERNHGLGVFSGLGRRSMGILNCSVSVFLFLFSILLSYANVCVRAVQLTLHIIYSVSVAVAWVVIASRCVLRLFRSCFAPVCRLFTYCVLVLYPAFLSLGCLFAFPLCRLSRFFVQVLWLAAEAVFRSPVVAFPS